MFWFSQVCGNISSWFVKLKFDTRLNELRPDDLPESALFRDYYGPSFKLHEPPSPALADRNTPAALAAIQAHAGPFRWLLGREEGGPSQ